MRKAVKAALKGAVLAGVLAVMMGANLTVFASPVIVAGEKPGKTNPGVKDWWTELSGVDQTDQYILVLGNGMDSHEVEVSYYKKDMDGIWKEQFQVSGFCGLNGMAADKREGDKRTPTGVYQFTQNFGILADPGSILPYKQVDSYDFWVDDGTSRYYNQMVNTREAAADWTSAEPLAQVAPAYNYALALNYNTDARTPGKGSAIFLHGLDSGKDWTSGCIAIPEEQVKLLVQEVDADTRIAILPEKPTAKTE